MSAAGIEGGKALSESAKDLERTRKAIALQLADFEGSKRNLMKDLQNRCEKVRFQPLSLSMAQLIVLLSLFEGGRAGDPTR